MKPGGMARNAASTHLGLRRTMTRPFLFCAVLAATAAGNPPTITVLSQHRYRR